MNKPMIFKEANEDGTDYVPDWAFESEHEFVINCKPQHDKLRNGTIERQVKENDGVLICVDGVIDGEDARMYLSITPSDLLEIGKIKAFELDGIGIGAVRKKELKKGYKSLTKEDIETIYNEETFHSLVLI